MKPIRGGKITTNVDFQELITQEDDSLRKVTIYNLSEKEVGVKINNGNAIPLNPYESINLGNLKIVSIIIIEKGSTVRYIGV